MLTIQNDNNGIWLMVISQASVCGRRAETVERRRRDGGNGVGAQRRRRAADGSPPLIAANTNAARDERAVCIEAKRCKPCVGRGGLAGLTRITWRWAVEISGRRARVVSSDRDNIATPCRTCGRPSEIFSCGQVRFEVVRPV